MIDYDRLTIEGAGADFYVSFDNEAVGKLQGEGLVKAVDGAELETSRRWPSSTDRRRTTTRPCSRTATTRSSSPSSSSGEWTLVDDQAVPDWDNQQALVIFEQILTAATAKWTRRFAANDGLANSVVSALKSQGHDPIPFTGQDATVGGIQNILAGYQSMTVYKAIKAEADAASGLAIALAQDATTDDLVTGQRRTTGRTKSRLCCLRRSP